MKTTIGYLHGHEIDLLAALAKRSRPMIRTDITRLEHDGLVKFVRETASGTTWYKITQLGRRVLSMTDAKDIG